MSRLLKSKLFLSLLLLFAVGAFGAALALRNKYQVKKFVRENKFLYEQAVRAGQVKNWLAQKFGVSGKQRNASHRKIDVYKQTWNLSVDASHSLGKYERFWGDIGFESWKAALLSSKSRELFEHIKAANARVGDGSFEHNAFRYIRAHNIFSNGQPPWGEGLEIYRTDTKGRASYDWTLTNKVFDKILSYGLKPIVEFGFMPDALASIPDRRQKWGRANISPPKNYTAWQNLVHATVKHLVARYGEREVASWYFEVWNEPDLGYLFWVEDPDPRRRPYGDMKEYHKLYDHTVAAARSAFPGIRIGGPASAGGAIAGLLEHLFLENNGGAPGQKGSPIDFVSTHGYNLIGHDYRQHQKVSLLGKIYWKLNSAVAHDHATIRSRIKTLPFLLTETGPKLRRKNEIVNKARYIAAWYVKMVDSMFYLADTLGAPFNPQEVVYWAGHQVLKDFVMTKAGIATSLKMNGHHKVFKLPIFNAIEALGHLSDERVRLVGGSQFGDVLHAIATRDSDRSVEILLYHLNEEINEVSNGTNPDSISVRLSIRNLPFHKFELREYAIDATHSNTYSVWLQLGSPKHLSRAQNKLLRQNQDLALCRPISRVSADDRNRFKLDLKMQAQSVKLLTLRRLN
ncbi:MAG: hypothetical protein ACE5IY_06490 [bacterium]